MSGRGDLSTGSLAWKSFVFGGPLALAMMGHGLFNLVDLVIVARVGQGAVAAVTLAGIVITAAMLIFDGVSNVTVAMVAHAHGARLRRMVHDVAWESLWLGVGAGVVGGAVFYFLSAPVVDYFRLADPGTVGDATEYLEVMAAGMITMFLIMQTTAVLRGVGDPLWPAAILIGANLLNIFLDIAMVYGKWGFPEMGVVGAAWATVISRGLGGLLGLWLIWRGTSGVCLRRIRFRRPFKYLRTLTFVGLPTSLQLAVRVIAVLFLLRIAREAETASAEALLDGVGICIRLEMVAVFMGLGWGGGATTLVGQNLGAKRTDRAARGTWITVAYAAGSMAAIGALLLVFQERLFNEIMPDLNPVGYARGEAYLWITVPFYPVMAVAFVLSRALNGAGSTRTPMAIDMFTQLLLMMPLALILSGVGVHGRPLDTDGAWKAAVVVHALTALVYVWVFRGGRWKHKNLTTLPAKEGRANTEESAPES